MRSEVIQREYGTAAPLIEAMIRDLGPLVEQTNPVTATFYANIRGLRQASIDYLTQRRDIPVLTLARDGDGLGATLGEAFVVFDGGRFEFSDPPHAKGAVRAIVIVARDESSYPFDLVAWAPETGRTASFFSRCTVLGAHDIDEPRAGTPLLVHRGVLDWLKADRRGVVVIDPVRAWRLFDGELLAAADVEHGIELQRTLQPPPPRIVVPGLRVAA